MVNKKVLLRSQPCSRWTLHEIVGVQRRTVVRLEPFVLSYTTRKSVPWFTKFATVTQLLVSLTILLYNRP
jgi:hypothetical protein